MIMSISSGNGFYNQPISNTTENAPCAGHAPASDCSIDDSVSGATLFCGVLLFVVAICFCVVPCREICRCCFSATDDEDEYLPNNGKNCSLTAELNWKIGEDLIEGGKYAENLRDCMVPILRKVPSGQGLMCLSSRGFVPNDKCWQALFEAEKDCGGPPVGDARRRRQLRLRALLALGELGLERF